MRPLHYEIKKMTKNVGDGGRHLDILRKMSKRHPPSPVCNKTRKGALLHPDDFFNRRDGSYIFYWKIGSR